MSLYGFYDAHIGGHIKKDQFRVCSTSVKIHEYHIFPASCSTDLRQDQDKMWLKFEVMKVFSYVTEFREVAAKIKFQKLLQLVRAAQI